MVACESVSFSALLAFVHIYTKKENRELSCGCRTNFGDFRHRCQIVIIILGDGPFLVTPISDGMAGDPTLFCQQGPTCDMLMGGPLPGTW